MRTDSNLTCSFSGRALAKGGENASFFPRPDASPKRVRVAAGCVGRTCGSYPRGSWFNSTLRYHASPCTSGFVARDQANAGAINDEHANVPVLLGCDLALRDPFEPP